jgi:hypothetical protein
LFKVEFQTGGWVHWHGVILGLNRIEHDLLQECWGWGFTWVKRMTPENIAYVCKYVTKGDSLPSFLYMEDRVRVVRTSNGFWGEEPRPRVESDEPRPQYLHGCYISIGERLERSRERCVVREVGTERRTLVRRSPLQVLALLRPLQACGGLKVGSGTDGRWIRVEMQSGEFLRLVGHQAGRGREAARPALHLNTKRKDDASRLWIGGRKWIHFACLDRLLWENELCEAG